MFNFLTHTQCELLRANGLLAQADENFDPLPVVKLFTPDAEATWLLTHIDPMEGNCAFGLCDLGLGHPEIGWVSLSELAEVCGLMGRPIVQDTQFQAVQRLGAYAREARLAGRVQA